MMMKNLFLSPSTQCINQISPSISLRTFFCLSFDYSPIFNCAILHFKYMEIQRIHDFNEVKVTKLMQAERANVLTRANLSMDQSNIHFSFENINGIA